MIMSLKRILKRAPTYLQYVWERPGWALLITFGRLHWARRIERYLRSSPEDIKDWPSSLLVKTPPRTEVMATLATDGICQGFSLTRQCTEEIARFAAVTQCGTRENNPTFFFPPDVSAVNLRRERDVLAAYYFDAVMECSAIRHLQVDPLLTAIAETYLGQAVRNIRCRLWWNFPATRYDEGDLHNAAQDKFHFDLNDWRTLKFFFYISDVDELSAPHLAITGSHKRKKLMHQYTIFQGKDRKELLEYYGPESFTTILGRAGSGFSEDPFVFHTGSVAVTAPRLLLELEFGPYSPSPSYRFGILG
jgi:hypothetical protein